MVDSYSPRTRTHEVLTYYADGVGSDGNPLGGAVGVGMSTDIKNAYAYLTRTWRPGDRIYLSGFSRGAYGARALGGLLYSAGIPDLRGFSPKQRNRIVADIFRAYKTGKHGYNSEALADWRLSQITKVYKKHKLFSQLGADRKYGYKNPSSRVIIDAFYGWDSVQAMGLPDGSESPVEGPDHYLMTNCNVRSVFHAVSLDDNRVYSFTPILAKGPRLHQLCQDDQSLNAWKETEEVWFSGAHADVGGTYNVDSMLDGRLPSVSFKWMIEKAKNAPVQLINPDTYVSEDRYGLVHDPETDGVMKVLFRQSRKPLPYTQIAYREESDFGIAKIKVHASVFDRLEYLFALDSKWDSCSSTSRRHGGVRLLCAKEIASYGLVPELLELGVLEQTDWGYRLVNGYQKYVQVDGQRDNIPPSQMPDCMNDSPLRTFVGRVFDQELRAYRSGPVKRKKIDVPYPHCIGPTAS